MWQLGVRHLPVLEGGSLVGVVSERDIAFAKQLTHADKLPVAEAMSAEPLVVGPQMPLGVVAKTMAENKVGCVIVVEGRDVVGIVTTTDALAILADFMRVAVAPPAAIVPSEVRARIRDEHDVLRRLLDECGRLAAKVLDGDKDAQPELCERGRELYRMLIRHIDLEDAILAPALRAAGAKGAQLAQKLEEEHRDQRYRLRIGLASLEAGWVESLARSMQTLIPSVRTDMQHEEAELLRESVLERVKPATA